MKGARLGAGTREVKQRTRAATRALATGYSRKVRAMKLRLLGSVMMAGAALAGCTTAGGLPPTQVVRYHLEQPIDRGTVGIVQASTDLQSPLGWQPYADAVQRQLAANGFTPAPAGTQPTYVATIGISSTDGFGPPRRAPFSIGLGIGGGSFGRGGGVGGEGGVGFPVGGSGPRHVLLSQLDVTIKRRADQTAVWEGHAHSVTDPRAPAADAGAIADKLASAMFAGFPGVSGRTIEVK